MPDNLIESHHLPKHIAIIMDGNGRWAKSKGKPRLFGHKSGVKAVRETIKTASRLGIQAVTLFAFSSENWKRPAEEVSLLMELFITALSREVSRLHKNNLRLRVIGDKTRFEPKLQKSIAAAEKLTENNTGTVVNVAANYGGQWDITQAVQVLAQQVEKGELTAQDITSGDIACHLSMADLPDVDLMIRTSGECRISNFMLWQMAYAELYFTDTFWPDFDEVALLKAISWFIERERRFGCTSEQLQTLMQSSHSQSQ